MAKKQEKIQGQPAAQMSVIARGPGSKIGCANSDGSAPMLVQAEDGAEVGSATTKASVAKSLRKGDLVRIVAIVMFGLATIVLSVVALVSNSASLLLWGLSAVCAAACGGSIAGWPRKFFARINAAASASDKLLDPPVDPPALS